MVWNIFDETPVEPNEQQMFDDACCNGLSRCAMPGSWAAIIFVEENYDPITREGIQILFVVVDP